MMFLHVKLAALAGLIVALGAQSAQAMVYDVKSLKVTNVYQPAINWLQITELEAFDSDGVNVARDINGGVATSRPGASTANLAINGIIDSVYSHGDMFHDGPGSWLTITFSSPSNLKSLNIFGRSDCCADNRDWYNIELFDAAGNSLYVFQVDARNADHMGTYEFIDDINPPAPGVPEPAVWAMMIGGFGLVGGAMRRRSTAALG